MYLQPYALHVCMGQTRIIGALSRCSPNRSWRVEEGAIHGRRNAQGWIEEAYTHSTGVSRLIDDPRSHPRAPSPCFQPFPPFVSPLPDLVQLPPSLLQHVCGSKTPHDKATSVREICQGKGRPVATPTCDRPNEHTSPNLHRMICTCSPRCIHNQDVSSLCASNVSRGYRCCK